MPVRLLKTGGGAAVGIGLVVAVAGMTPAAASPAAAGTGSAYAAQMSVTVDAGSYGAQGLTVDTGRLGASSTAGPTSASALSAGMQGLVSAKVLTSSSHRIQASGGVVSKAALVQVTLPMLRAAAGATATASVISSQCRSSREGISGSADLVDVDLGKLGVISRPMPNLKVGIPGVVQVVANEQIHNADGSLSVNALDIQFLAGAQTYGMASGHVVLASATCGPAVAAVAPPIATAPAPTSTPPAPPTAVPPSVAPVPTPAPTSRAVRSPHEVKVVPVGAPQTGDGSLASTVVD